VRIAFSGAHATGKSTLVGELAGRLPDYFVVEEEYYAATASGIVFAADPSPDDFGLLLRRSCSIVKTSAGPDLLFDRCPVDYLAYLSVRGAHHPSVMAGRVERAMAAMARIDLVVFVPIERPDRIAVGEDEHPRLRRRVDVALREILLGDSWGFGKPVIEVSGTPDDRAIQVLARLAEA